jgi:Na+/melibiose symporter-like transporter
LVAQADRRSYAKLTEAFNPKEREKVSTLLPDLSIGYNMITLGFTCFVLCYVGAGTVYKTVGERLVAGLVGLVGILLVEMVLFISRETKADAARASQPKNVLAQKAKLA